MACNNPSCNHDYTADELKKEVTIQIKKCQVKRERALNAVEILAVSLLTNPAMERSSFAHSLYEKARKEIEKCDDQILELQKKLGN